MKKYLLLLVILLSMLIPANANPNADDFIKKSKTNFFIENKGQWNPEVKFLVKIGGMNAWITDNGIVYDFYKIEYDEGLNIDSLRKAEPSDWMKKRNENARRLGHVVRMNFIDYLEQTSTNKLIQQIQNNNHHFKVQGKDKLETYYNYFIGNDSTKWASYVGLYKEVIIKNVYEGIDYRLYFDKGMLRYDLNIQPFADLEQIRMKYEGQEGLDVNEIGELEIKTSIGEIKNQKLYAFQNSSQMNKETEIPVQFTQYSDGSIGFLTKNYDKSLALTIDPLIYSTFIGGNSNDEAYSITIDNLGSAYVTGVTVSSVYPTTNGAYNLSINGLDDAFVTKLNASGSSLNYSTFIGGARFDCGRGITIDETGAAYVTGYTYSSTFPTTSGSYDEIYNGNNDVFVTKLNSSGSTLLYSTYIGGNSNDEAFGIALDNSGAAYVTGWTQSYNYPTSSGAFDETFNENWDGFVTKLNPSGSSIIYSTFLGGRTFYDKALDIIIDGTGIAYVTGWTSSTDFPITSGAFDKSYNGGIYDIFVSKLNESGSSLIYSTFIGGGSNDVANGLAIDETGASYVTGWTSSPDFPTTIGVYDESYNTGYDVFVTKLNANGSSLIYSTFIGGDDGISDVGNGITVDDKGSTYVTGWTDSYNYPTTSGSYDESLNGLDDVFVTKLNPSCSTLLYSTFIGGASNDNAYGITINDTGTVYVTGWTMSPDYPTTSNAYDKSFNGGEDVFVAKLSLSLISIETDLVTPVSYCFGSSISIPFTITGTYNSGNIFTAQLSDSSGDFSSPTNIGTLSGTSKGIIKTAIPYNIPQGFGYRFRVISSNPEITGTDNGVDIAIYSLPAPQITNAPNPVCSGNPYSYSGNNTVDVTNKWESYAGTIVGSDSGGTVNIIWDSGNSGTITLVQTITATGCKDSVSQTITIYETPKADIFGNYNVCQGYTENYQTNRFVNVTNLWTVDNGTIIGSSTADTILVEWDSAGIGSITLMKIDTITNCTDTTVKDIIIKPVPIVTYKTPTKQLCLSDSAFMLIGGNPIGGTYSGNGVINGWFDPIEDGDYEITYTYIDEEGCSNSAKDTINVLPNPEKPTITKIQRKLISSDAISYQWYIDSTIIPSATSKEFTPTKKGYYQVEVTDENGCKSISDAFYFGSIGVSEKQEKENILSIKPNPFSETASIIFTLQESSFVSLVITNLLGININEIYSNKYMESGQHVFQINVNNLPKGVYYCTMRIGMYNKTVKMVIVK